MFSSNLVHLFQRWSIDLEVCWLDELSSILASCLVSVRVGLEGTGIDDSLVVHQLVTLVVWKGVEIVVFGVSDDLIRFVDLGLARLLLWVLDSSSTFWRMTS